MIALAFPALMLINAVFFHIAPFFKMRGRFSPGLITAVILFLPMGMACYVAANDAGVLDTTNLIGWFVLAALLMAMPIVLLHIKSKTYFRQDHP
ncbi:MAG: HXXEE domain-containing protein [Proteobacteria bacterium]|nr:HXXEE domain-containing protein [Pseudomonadota bacterium]